MEEADKLCELLFTWLEKRKKCADKLLELAEELEDLRCKSTAVQLVGNTAAVAGFAVAAAATFFTAGLAAPLAVAGAGTVVSLTSKVTEMGLSSKTLSDAKYIIKEDDEIQEKIQKQMNKLNVKCARHMSGASSEEEECEVATQMMGALARRYGMNVSLDLLRSYNRTTYFMHSDEISADHVSSLLTSAMGLAVSLSCLSLKFTAREVVKDIGVIGTKNVVKGVARVAGSALGLALSLHDLIENCEELAKDNHETEASQSLRSAATKIKEGRDNLKEKLDALLDIVRKLTDLKECFKKLGKYSSHMDEDGQRILNYIMATCHNPIIISWLQERYHDIQFLNLLRYVRDHLPLEQEIKKRRGREDEIHIVFVAHGGIGDQFMPAAVLVPLPSIIDTFLYSPWNCFIDANAGYGIASGRITVHNRSFYTGEDFVIDIWPKYWNSMRRSTHAIPLISLSPVGYEEPVWKSFKELEGFLHIRDRIIIPYLVPDGQKHLFPTVPFYIFTLVTAFILMLMGVKATLHLAACLGRSGSPVRAEEWSAQYAYTFDNTVMSMNMNAIDVPQMDAELFRAFRLMFGTQRRHRRNSV